ncbi:MAG: hypothetical protein GTO29_11270 [Candidatus Latescibacteria bacterium]|nr:hypothetical protein [Candidatus Latescibacterota bacterium]NIO56744.1 hypothetical protein [Candidatus Latescibacterota bacterium]NIT02329.1 hypothetical protein [Candidatus Latescibacterota bacterium]NIT39212.1 hypothetical protein [Candidatus Latescibacterota bacterium]
MKTFKLIVTLLIVLALYTSSAANAQILSSTLKSGEAELGYIHKWFHRDMEPNLPTEMRWEVSTLFARYGGFEWLTLSVEGAISIFDHEDFPGLKYRRYALGGGVAAKLYQYRQWAFAGCFHFNEVWDHDRSANHFDKRTRGVITGLQIIRSFTFRNHAADVWIGPMYVDDIGETYPWDSNTPIKNEASDNFGVAMGAHTVFFKHFAGLFYVVYANYFQARLGIALHLGEGK